MIKQARAEIGRSGPGWPVMFAALLLLMIVQRAEASRPPLLGGLEPGPFAVGFRSTWELDPTRTYNTTFKDKTTYANGKAPRPILINIWYPAERPTGEKLMPHRTYFAIGSDDPRLSKFAEALADYERAVVCKEVFDVDEAKLDEGRRRLFDRLLSSETTCFRDVKPLDRKSPLVIYHSGAQSSFEDNSVLCEYLASHGYVVIGSAFQEASGTTFNIDGFEGSSRDMAFLIGYAARLSYADWTHVAVAGHSAGAQACLLYASKGSTPIDAVVSLDTTQDYASLATRGWDDLVSACSTNPAIVT